MDFLASNSLSSILLILFFTAVFISFVNLKEVQARMISFGSSILVLIIALIQYFFLFDKSSSQLQFIESYDWIGPIKFSLGVDGLSFSMVLLNAILLPCVILASEKIASTQKPRLYYSLILLLSLAVFTVFMAKDIFLFFLAWEFELVPMYFLIAIWGSKNRNYASMKFLLYTFFAGVFLLIGIFSLLMLTGFTSFDMVDLASKISSLLPNLDLVLQVFLFSCFFICFLVKLPSVPVHTWLPDAHVEAPTPVSMLLAGILLKMGSYGLLRFGLEFFPSMTVKFAPWLALLGVINIIYAAYAALIQKDLKKLIAYSSVSHMGFILLGLGSLNTVGYSGAVFQMFSHGLVSAALFMLVGMLYERTHTRMIADFGGLAKVLPRTFYFFLVAAMANLGLPGLSGFVGESMVFYGAFSSNAIHRVLNFDLIQISVAFAVLGLILTAAYMLWANERVFNGPLNEKWINLSDARTTETTVIAVLLGLSLICGIYPSLLNDIFKSQLNSLAYFSSKFIGI
jgi:NADH-quinone oxidoreductase subunit M